MSDGISLKPHIKISSTTMKGVATSDNEIHPIDREETTNGGRAPKNPKPKFFLHDETIAWLKDNMTISNVVHMSAVRGEYVDKLDVQGILMKDITPCVMVSIADVPICNTMINIPMQGYVKAIEKLVHINENLMIALTRQQQEINTLQIEVETLKN